MHIFEQFMCFKIVEYFYMPFWTFVFSWMISLVSHYAAYISHAETSLLETSRRFHRSKVENLNPSLIVSWSIFSPTHIGTSRFFYPTCHQRGNVKKEYWKIRLGNFSKMNFIRRHFKALKINYHIGNGKIAKNINYYFANMGPATSVDFRH